MSQRKPNEEQRAVLFATMDACDEGYADGPDGAWQQMLLDCVKQFNRREGMRLDPWDTFMGWLTMREGTK